MRKTLSGLLICSALLISFGSRADGTSADFVIQELQFLTAYDGVLLQHSLAPFNPDSCTISNRVFISYSVETPDRGRAAAAGAMMAFALGRNVRAYVNGCAPVTTGTAPLVKRFYVD